MHALQHDELGSYDERTEDADNVRLAMIEGEATLYEHLTALELRGRERDAAEWRKSYQKGIKSKRRGMVDEDSAYHATSWFLYSLSGTAPALRGGASFERKFTVEPDGGDLLVRASDREGLLEDWRGANDCNR